MAKSLTSIVRLSALLFVFLVLSNTFETPTMVEADCERPSARYAGVCGNSGGCSNQCKEFEGAFGGTCRYKFPSHRCVCFFRNC